MCELNEIIYAKTSTNITEGPQILTITIIIRSSHMSSHIFIRMKEGVCYYLHFTGEPRLEELSRSRDFYVPELGFEPRPLWVCCSSMHLSGLLSSSYSSTLFPGTFGKPSPNASLDLSVWGKWTREPEPLDAAAGWVGYARLGMQGGAEGVRAVSPGAAEPLALGALHRGLS